MTSRASGVLPTNQSQRGTVIWKFEPSLDLLFTKEEIEKLPEIAQKQIHNYAYLDASISGKYLLCGDDARFFNHSDDPNCYDAPLSNVTTALRDIARGEEFTCNYKSFYGNIEEHPEIG